tara:strand:+ start:76 stop:348 length:273 start_codon:yes stop_codon:yes gene_type:complete
MKDNKLIAEFMGVHEIMHDGYSEYELPSNEIVQNLQYHTSWDWLMPVVQKCFEVAKHEDDFSVIIWSLPYMDSVYNEVVEFIKGCNDEKQ